MNILAIGAHHDDVEFGCFGTLTRHRQNDDKVVVAVMSNGALKHSVNDDVIRTPARSEKETEKSMGLIGVEDIIHLNYQDTAVPFSRETISDIERLVDKHNIDMVYTHWAGDTHQDHINTLDSTLSACRNVKNVLCYEQVPLPRVTTTYPVANYFVDITDTIDKKLSIMEIYKSEVMNDYGPRSLSSIRALNRYRGSRINVEYAEAFILLYKSA